MDITTGRMRAAMIAAASVALLVAGCASGGGPGGSLDGNPEESAPVPGDGTSTPIDPDAFESPEVVWVDEGMTFALTTWGSSSCPSEVEEVLLGAADLVTLQFAAPSDGICTADMAPTTQTIELPDGADGRPLRIDLRSHDGSVATGLSLG